MLLHSNTLFSITVTCIYLVVVISLHSIHCSQSAQSNINNDVTGDTSATGAVNTSSSRQSYNMMSENDLVKQKWVRAANKFDQLIWPHAQLYEQLINNALADSSLNFSHQCREASKFLINGIKSRKHWAIKFIDSTGRGRAGMAYGYVADIGNMDECITIDVNINQKDKLLGKYCLASLDFPKLTKDSVHPLFGINFSLHDTPLKDTVYELYAIFMEQMMYTPVGFKFGICIPSECDQKQVQKFLQKQLEDNELTVTISQYCEILDQPIASHHLVAIVIATAYCLFVVLATYFTWNNADDSSANKGFLDHFNMINHSQKLFAETTDPLAQKLSFFHGVRFFYQLAAITFHSIDIYPFLPTAYAPMYIREWPFWLFDQAYKSIGFFVQIPFAVSGFLTYCTMFPYFKSKKGSVSFADYMFKRWYRTTPLMLGVILFGYVWSAMGRGPAFREVQDMTIEKCSKYWWANILYINNWFNWDEMCLFHTWSYSADFQLYAIAFLIIKLAVRDVNQALKATLILIASGCAASGFVTWWNDLAAFPDFDAIDARQYDQAPWMYFHTYNMIPAYFIGLLAAILFLDDRQIPLHLVSPIWWLVVIIALSTQFVPRIIPFDGLSYRWIEIVFASVHRVFFVAPFVWTGYLSSFNLGGWIQAMYSVKAWTPFGRMSSSVFLAHYSFIWFDLANGQDYVSTRGWNLTMKSFYIMLASYLYSYLIYLLFEGPSMAIAKAYLLPARKDISSVNVNATADTAVSTNGDAGETQSSKKDK